MPAGRPAATGRGRRGPSSLPRGWAERRPASCAGGRGRGRRERTIRAAAAGWRYCRPPSAGRRCPGCTSQPPPVRPAGHSRQQERPERRLGRVVERAVQFRRQMSAQVRPGGQHADGVAGQFAVERLRSGTAGRRRLRPSRGPAPWRPARPPRLGRLPPASGALRSAQRLGGVVRVDLLPVPRERWKALSGTGWVFGSDSRRASCAPARRRTVFPNAGELAREVREAASIEMAFRSGNLFF